MSPFLRIEMIILALAIMVMVFRSINRGRLLVRFSLIWLTVSVGILLAAAFPGIVDWLCQITKIKTPSNLIYLLGILTLLVIVFKQTEIISQHTEQIKRLTQEISLERKRAEEALQSGEETK